MRRGFGAMLLAAGLTGPVPAQAFDIPEAAIRLATIDSELSACFRNRLLATVLVVKALRDCIADKRPDERDLRKNLNELLSTLGGEDPDRAKALSVREGLNLIRAFMNRMDNGLKDLPDGFDAQDVEILRAAACEDSGIDGTEGALLLSVPEYAARNGSGFRVCLPEERTE